MMNKNLLSFLGKKTKHVDERMIYKNILKRRKTTVLKKTKRFSERLMYEAKGKS